MSAEFGYTLATERLFTTMDEFHREMEALMGRPVLTHEFADKATWDEARKRFEERAAMYLAPPERPSDEADGLDAPYPYDDRMPGVS